MACHYLLGRHFVVRTDQRSSKFLLEQRLESDDHQKWLTKLIGYQFDIQHRPGLENKAADALSQMQPSLGVLALTTLAILQLEEVKKEVAVDKTLGKLVTDLQVGVNVKLGYAMIGGVVLPWKNCVAK